MLPSLGPPAGFTLLSYQAAHHGGGAFLAVIRRNLGLALMCEVLLLAIVRFCCAYASVRTSYTSRSHQSVVCGVPIGCQSKSACESAPVPPHSQRTSDGSQPVKLRATGLLWLPSVKCSAGTCKKCAPSEVGGQGASGGTSNTTTASAVTRGCSRSLRWRLLAELPPVEARVIRSWLPLLPLFFGCQQHVASL